MRRRALLIALCAVPALVATLGRGGVPASPAAGATTKPVTVRMGEFFYRPRLITVHVGQAVRFVNVGRIEHTVADTDARWNIRSRLIRPRPLAHGQVQVVRFPRAATVRYLCTFHPTLMRGRIVVVR